MTKRILRVVANIMLVVGAVLFFYASGSPTTTLTTIGGVLVVLGILIQGYLSFFRKEKPPFSRIKEASRTIKDLKEQK